MRQHFPDSPSAFLSGGSKVIHGILAQRRESFEHSGCMNVYDITTLLREKHILCICTVTCIASIIRIYYFVHRGSASITIIIRHHTHTLTLVYNRRWLFTHTQTHTCTHMHTDARTHTHTGIKQRIARHTHINTRTHTCTHTHVHTRMYALVYNKG